MPIQLFLNDLSTPQSNVPEEVAADYLKAVIGTIQAAKVLDRKVVLNSEEPIGTFSFGSDISLAQLRNRQDCREESLFLKTLLDRSPLRKVAAKLDGPDPDGFEYRIGDNAPILAGKEARALGFSHIFSGISISMNSHDFWTQLAIPIDRLDIDEDGEITCSEVDVMNACSPDDITALRATLRATARPVVADGADLWLRRNDVLPYLKFIPRTRQQIEGFARGDPAFEHVLDRLFGVNSAIEEWILTGSGYPDWPFDVTPESASRLKHVKFKDKDGVERTFSDHVYFPPDTGRLHFIVESKPSRHALVGHVGRKLGIG